MTISRSPASPTTASRDACVFARIRQLSRLVNRLYDDALRPIRITASQYILLRAVADGSPNAAILAIDFDIEKSTLSRNLKRLAALTYIEIGVPKGRRGKKLTLTDKGRAALEHGKPLWADAERSMRAAIHPITEEMVIGSIASMRRFMRA